MAQTDTVASWFDARYSTTCQGTVSATSVELFCLFCRAIKSAEPCSYEINASRVLAKSIDEHFAVTPRCHDIRNDRKDLL